MIYFFAFIFVSWGLIYYFLRDSGGPMKDMLATLSEMKSATVVEDKRNAARRILEIIDRETLAGVVVDDARIAAEAVIRNT